MRPQIVKILAPVFCFLTAIPMLGQGPSASSGPPPPTRMCPLCLPEDPLPLDSDIVFLIVVAILYGLYVAYKNRKSINTLQ